MPRDALGSQSNVRASRRIVLLVEGDSERGDSGRQSLAGFLKRWLDPQVPQGRRVGIDAVNLGGIDKYLDNVGSLVESRLSLEPFLLIMGIVDLYGIPEHRISLSGLSTVREKVSKARAEIVRMIKPAFRNRFRQHFAVHEFEAWLLAYPEYWPTSVRARLTRRPPEEVNFQEPPAKLLHNLLGSRFRKTVDARRILARADPAVAIEKCPHLKTLTTDLLQFAQLLI